MSGILFYGDPHGSWKPLLRAWERHLPEAVVLLGDCDLDRPLRERLAIIVHAGTKIRWIPGNHDTDSEEWWYRLADDCPEWSLHRRWAQLGGRLVAGLGGTYRGRIWYPREGHEPYGQHSPDEMLRNRDCERWRGGLPLRLRSSIFPSDHGALREFRCDVLVTHEAPSNHEYGFGSIDDLARDMGARLVVHGHHHRHQEGETRDGIRVVGLGKAEPWLLLPRGL
jgi:predicted phosphodiesterase